MRICRRKERGIPMLGVCSDSSPSPGAHHSSPSEATVPKDQSLQEFGSQRKAEIGVSPISHKEVTVQESFDKARKQL